MSAWTLEQAKQHLHAWMEAELKVTAGQNYRIGSRELNRANLYQIREEIKYWKNQVEALENQSKRRGTNRVMRIVPRDL
ncbi:DUF6148 family protein [Cellulosilyticum sp. I15G10I2]|uniref:DUF6148 family protein n=1 Tax=Cellulosilyticum sp. I15G10I2 TaxID=1892843 RepID=UPI00085C98C5|nr:DUF6148 family protein [Cellulosilyticum sp. I15G10I2]